MGKDNLFLGFGRGKLGDSVFYRTDGEQRWRARNRSPKNPRSNKQLVQRAIMATTMAVYSAGKAIFDHSFQGYSVGSMNQRRFMKLNANMLRSAVAAEFGVAAAEESLAKVTAPGIQTPIPNQWIISEGSLSQNLFVKVDDPSYHAWSLPAFTANEKVNEYAARVGLVAGDIYTFVFISTSKDPADVLFKALGIASVEFDIVYRGGFGWCRFIAKDVSSVETVMSNNTLLSTLFDFEQGGVASFNFTDLTVEAQFAIDSLVSDMAGVEDNGFSIGLIKSRRDVDLRSNASMYVGNPDEFGLYWNDILDAWRAGTTPIGESDLILEGGDI